VGGNGGLWADYFKKKNLLSSKKQLINLVKMKNVLQCCSQNVWLMNCCFSDWKLRSEVTGVVILSPRWWVFDLLYLIWKIDQLKYSQTNLWMKKEKQNSWTWLKEVVKRSPGPKIDPGSKSPRVGQNWLNLTLNMSFPHVKIGVQIGQILVGWKLHDWRFCLSQSNFLSSLNMFLWMDNWKALD